MVQAMSQENGGSRWHCPRVPVQHNVPSAAHAGLRLTDKYLQPVQRLLECYRLASGPANMQCKHFDCFHDVEILSLRWERRQMPATNAKLRCENMTNTIYHGSGGECTPISSTTPGREAGPHQIPTEHRSSPHK